MRAPDQSEMAYHMPFLEELAAHALIVLEIGCGHGNGSTRAFDAGLRAGQGVAHIIVDIDPERPQEMPAPGHHHIVKVTGDSASHETAEKVLDYLDILSPDLIFIDTHHTYEQMKAELEVWSPLAGADTIWVFHDTWMSGSYNPMTDAIKEFCEAHPEWIFTDHTQKSHGLGLMRRRV